MSWTFDPEMIASDQKDEVRFMVGDITETTALVEDEEITLRLTQFPATDKPPWLAAAAVCDAIAGRLARKMQQTLGPISAAQQMQFDHYVAMAQQYRVLYATNGKGIVTGSTAGATRALPVLSGGGPTYLGGTPYENHGDGSGA